MDRRQNGRVEYVSVGKMFKQYLKIVVGSNHDITRIKSILAKHDPKIVVFESESPTANNRVIRYAQYYAKNGWEKMNIKIKTRCKSTGKRAEEFHVISVMLRQLSYEAKAEEM